MPDPFVHLHVASGYSLQYGASHPHVLVERAVEQEMDTLALTDRDGTYGAVRFAKACLQAGVRPVLGVDLAVAPSGLLPVAAGSSPGGRRTARTPRTPVRGGAFRDPGPERGGLPRMTFLAAGKRGWATLCRLVSATHLAGERGTPVTTREIVAEHLAAADAGDVLVLLGPGSELGRAATLRRDDLAHAVLASWREVVDPADLLVEVVSHRLPGSGPGSSPHAARMLGAAREHHLGAVLTNAVRYADRVDATTVDVLDAARRLVPLDLRHVDRGNAEGFLKSGKQMAEVADEICRFAGLGDSEREARRLLARTRAVGDRCALDPRADLGLGEIHFPEFGASRDEADRMLRARCEGAIGDRYGSAPKQRVWKRLDDELQVISRLGYASYFLTVGDVTDLIKEMGVRCAARGSGAGSLVNYLLGISGVEPLRHNLLMERFLSPLRQALPDVDVDVESARRLEVYEAVLDRYGGERCVCVSMMDTYRVRHAVRDVGAALGMPLGEIDAIAKAFPHIRARDARVALRELPELRASGLGEERLDLMFRLVERLDGLPRHIAVHPCGVLLSDATLLDRTPVEASYAGFPMSQFDKEDVEDLGLLKLDVLGIRMQSSMAHAVAEIRRVDGVTVDLDDEEQVPLDDEPTYRMISTGRTLGCFQIESPGQRELVGKSGIETFEQVITDISLFRPGPVKSDMITPYLDAKQGWKMPLYLHDDLRPILGETHGVVVFHEQVIEIIAQFAGCTLAEADEARRALGDVEGMAETKLWFFPRAVGRGYPRRLVGEVWKVLEAFASFGFCKAHAAAFALPTYQSAWLKRHWPAHFLAGVLTHDPGMYPKRLILEDARQLGIAVLPLDVNASEKEYVVEKVGLHDEPPPEIFGAAPRQAPHPDLPDGRAYGIRLALDEVKGIAEAEVLRIVAARPYQSLTDFWHRARVSRPVVERLVLAGAFDSIYGIGSPLAGRGVRRRGTVTRRDLLLQVADLDRHTRAIDRAGQGRGRGLPRSGTVPNGREGAAVRAEAAARANSSDDRVRAEGRDELAVRPSGARSGHEPWEQPSNLADQSQLHPARAKAGVWEQAARQSQATRKARPVTSVQLALDLGDAPVDGEVSGLPEMSASERVRAELEILGLDVSRHVVDFYAGLLDALDVTRSVDLLNRRSKSELLVAGVKVATQTPPIRSGRRVVFLTLDDGTGPVDATFFEDAQGPYAATVFGSWLLLVRGELRRTGHQGVSLRATGCWELSALHDLWQREGIDAVREVLAAVPEGFAAADVDDRATRGAAESRATRPVMAKPASFGGDEGEGDGVARPGGGAGAAGGMGRRRVLVHSSGFKMSPYADIKPAGEDTKSAPRKLWHSSPGSSGA
ncbi:DNA polymerase III subunit alpha [Nocardioides iriomotensis]|uniref:DNA polymerase III subunit alpha n=1 Tax=Nocardioides iriomotensis TaxID=715784 RepID=A0A4Q5J331_9ACTN|nr:DNA polymerase III subunit alpha [Nocardioides iriomotensis]RYU11841.1 DNA polymerase III subunit alpha [Nocardioides iriomotensis]